MTLGFLIEAPSGDAVRHALRQLHYLTVAAQAGSFRRAAELCDVDQSSVSWALRQLEDHIGIMLFERSRCGVRLTTAGEQFLAEVAPALEQLESARRSARAMRRAETGLLRIGILTSLAGGFPSGAGVFQEPVAVVSRYTSHGAFDPPERVGQVRPGEFGQKADDLGWSGLQTVPPRPLTGRRRHGSLCFMPIIASNAASFAGSWV